MGLLPLPCAAAYTIGHTSAVGNDLTSAIVALAVFLTPYAVVSTALADNVSLNKRDMFVKRTNWMWRAAYLPYRDWPPLSDEIGRWTRIDIPGSDLRVFRRV
ncbi:hypothetical protein J5X84_19910 [Streptosporangiaceae bacterium NEAU-GS5]|nr:hypothetical protein [Streptosporangiaceae bacterium NEAU-GS5]